LEQIDVIRRLVDKYPNQMQLATTAKGEAGVHKCPPSGTITGSFLLGTQEEMCRRYVEKLQMLRRGGTLFGKSGEPPAVLCVAIRTSDTALQSS
jgi:hypothetical protein